MAKLKNIAEGWAKSLGVVEVTAENKVIAINRVQQCIKCRYGQEMWLKKFVDGFLQRDVVGSGIGCTLCGCPVNEKALVLDETCPHPEGSKW